MPRLQHTVGLLIGCGLVVAVAVGCSSDGGATGAAAGDDAVKDEFKLEQQFALSMAVTSTKFNATRRIPRQYSCTREGISPPISWGEAPAGTMSLALVVDSNQHAGPPWVHWVLWGIPADARSLPEEVPNTALAPSVGPNAAQGTNTEDKIGWTGPCPSPVLLSRGHQESAVATYTFKLFALDTELNARDGDHQERSARSYRRAHPGRRRARRRARFERSVQDVRRPEAEHQGLRLTKACLQACGQKGAAANSAPPLP